MGLIRDAVAGAISGGAGGGGAMGALQGAAKGAAGLNNTRKKRPGSDTDVSGAGPIPFQEETSDQGSGEGARRKRSNGKSRL